MAQTFQLTEKDKKLLKRWGYLDKDLQYIEEGANVGKLTFTYKGGRNEHEITPQQAIRLIGREQFLSGLSRSTFHWTAVRYRQDNDKNGYVSFDMSRTFE